MTTLVLVAGQPVAFTGQGSLSLVSGAGGAVGVVVSNGIGGAFTLSVGGPSVFISGGPGGQQPIYATASPVTSVCQPQSPAQPAPMPRTAAALRLQAASPNLNIAVQPAPPQLDAPIGLSAPVPGTTIALVGGTGAYEFALQ